MLIDRGYELIKRYEGYLRPLNDGTDRVRPYLCPARVATIGWGSTRYFSYNGITAHSTGRVKMSDDPITRERAEECFRGELHQNELAVDRYITVQLHPLMRDALVSFTYNCGEGALRSSTLRRVINKRDWQRVPREFAKWRMGGGRVLRGLERRRAEEARLFMEGVRKLQSGELDKPPPPEPTPVPLPVPKPIQEPPKGWWRRLMDWIFS